MCLPALPSESVQVKILRYMAVWCNGRSRKGDTGSSPVAAEVMQMTPIRSAHLFASGKLRHCRSDMGVGSEEGRRLSTGRRYRFDSGCSLQILFCTTGRCGHRPLRGAYGRRAESSRPTGREDGSAGKAGADIAAPLRGACKARLGSRALRVRIGASGKPRATDFRTRHAVSLQGRGCGYGLH